MLERSQPLFLCQQFAELTQPPRASAENQFRRSIQQRLRLCSVSKGFVSPPDEGAPWW